MKSEPQAEAEAKPSTPTVEKTAARADRRSGSMQINLGRTIQIKGDLIGSEDLTIEGKVEGKIFLREHHLTIGENGDIKADVQAKEVVVAGKLIGNITAKDRVEVTSTGSLLGDIRAPRVVLSDGARFRGSVDMEPRSGARAESVSESGAVPGERPRTVARPPGTTP